VTPKSKNFFRAPLKRCDAVPNSPGRDRAPLAIRPSGRIVMSDRIGFYSVQVRTKRPKTSPGETRSINIGWRTHMSKLFKLISLFRLFDHLFRGRRYGHSYHAYHGAPRPYHHRSFKTYLAERALRRLTGRRHY
jgi:hypothetical protein